MTTAAHPPQSSSLRQDEFDKSYIIAQVERFCSLYNIRGVPLDDLGQDPLFSDYGTPDGADVGADPGTDAGSLVLPPYLDPGAIPGTDLSKLSRRQATEVSKAHRMAKDAEKALELERKHNMKREQKRVAQERKEQKAREREAHAVRKAQERAAREATKEERKRKKVEIREHREKLVKEQKDAALKRAAELVSSNRVPIEITRGAAAAKAGTLTWRKCNSEYLNCT